MGMQRFSHSVPSDSEVVQTYPDYDLHKTLHINPADFATHVTELHAALAHHLRAGVVLDHDDLAGRAARRRRGALHLLRDAGHLRGRIRASPWKIAADAPAVRGHKLH